MSTHWYYNGDVCVCVFVCMLIYDIICKSLDSLTKRDLDLFMLIFFFLLFLPLSILTICFSLYSLWYGDQKE